MRIAHLAEMVLARTAIYDRKSCWPWTAFRDQDGYGNLCISPGGRNRNFRAHRLAWRLDRRKLIPPGKVVMHTCDNPPCMNPAHLRLGTMRSNRADCVTKGRNAQGVTHAAARLTEEDVLTIRDVYAKRQAIQSELARIYGVGQVTISKIVTGRTWKHVGGPLRGSGP